MNSVKQNPGKSKKRRTLGEPRVMGREEYAGLAVEGKIEMIRALIPLGLMHIREVLDQEVEVLAGKRYGREDERPERVRHGSNPGSVRLAGQRHPIRIPRVRDRARNQEVRLQSLEQIRGSGEVEERLLKRVLYGISCRNYEAAAEAIPGAIGLAASTVSRHFIEASAERLRELHERDLSAYDVVAVFLDGKVFAEDTLVMALGVTASGEKIVLGFVQAGTENEKTLRAFLVGLVERGLRIEAGVLVVIDGSKGLRAAVKRAFRDRAVVQRCQWHKRENVVGYLPKGEQTAMRRQLERAHQKPTYLEAKNALMKIHADLEERNLSAAASLAEGLEETLTLHRLGVFELLGKSFKTTNCIESVMSGVEERCGKVDHWKNSSQKQRWLASALLDIEPRLRRVKGYRYLFLLRKKIQEELGIEPTTKAA